MHLHFSLAYCLQFISLSSFTGVYTRESMKNYKSLEAHNYFRSGWVETVLLYQPSDSEHSLLKAFVKPSQKLNDEQYSPWVAVTSLGQVTAAHCNCMAG